jgi:YVTN family beta-propeller protein
MPCALCYNPTNNKVYVANFGSGSVTVIDGASDSVVATVPTDSKPSALCYNPTNNKIYCARADPSSPEVSDSTVTVIDGATNEVVATIGVGVEPVALVCNPARNRVYVANYYWSSISVLRDSTEGVEENLKPQATGLKPTPTIIRGVLFLPPAPLSPPSSLLSADGRKVLDLRPGANDVSHISPGVYFIREGLGTRGEGLGKTQKVVLTR